MKNMVNRLPGVAGIIGGKHRSKNTIDIGNMLGRLEYGGRERAGIYSDERSGTYIGWTKYGNDLSFSAPVWNRERNICLFIWGETFQDPGIHGGNTPGDGRLELLRCYECEGLGSFEKLNGWFAGILVDLRFMQTVLFNDRYGLFRIHYHEAGDGFFFASEAKAIMAAVPETRDLDFRGLAEFISCGSILQNRTMFTGISLLPGGSAWVFEGQKGIKKGEYFQSAQWESQVWMNYPEYYENLKETWKRVLRRQLGNDENMALSLTGGVDSRMILASAPCPAGALKCYTFAGAYRDSADIAIARRAAEACGQPHESIYVGCDFLSQFTDLAESTVYISDGTMDISGSIDVYVQRIAQQIAPVRVTGTNGGEILRSLVAFKPAVLYQDIFVPELKDYIQAAGWTYSVEFGKSKRLTFTVFKQTPWYMNPKFILERSQIKLRMPYFDNELVSLVYRAPRTLPLDNSLALRLISDEKPALAEIETDRGLTVRMVPGISQARHIFRQFTFRLDYVFDYGMPSWLAKLDSVLSPVHLERYILGRHKFHHFRIWYRNELSGYLKEILLDPRTMRRPYLNGPLLERMVTRHIKGLANYTTEIHRILAVELLQRQLVEKSQHYEQTESN